MDATGKGTAWQEKVKNILGDLGIAGETVTPSPARTIEELATLGIIKGYSTVVAVGSENLVDKIITVIINQKGAKDVVLGVIPADFNSPIARKIHIKDLRDACNTLKYRKLTTIDVCFIEPNKYFLTEAIIETSKSIDAYLTLDHIKAGLPFNKIVIKPGLRVYIDDESSPGKNKLFGWLLGKKEEKGYASFFKTKKIRIETLATNVPVKVDNETIAKTPITCQNRSKALKIIVARDTINLKE
jgi:diacylglycerol kinase family enzyme